MKIEKAKSLYHGEEKYNCSQAILAAFQDEYNVSNELIAEHKANGGGRAPEGLCGAAYAVLELTDKSMREHIISEFTDKAGYLNCCDIKSNKSLSCVDCVGVAAEILQNIID